MYRQHPVFLDPDKPFELLWRYMDWPRFYLLLKTRYLYFISARILRKFDSFEGSLPKKELDFLLSDQHWDMEMVRRSQDQLRRENFVSCWHYNDSESIAMWKLYAPTGNGIAVQTTIPEFKRAFDSSGYDIYAGQVQYIDYASDNFYQDNPRGVPFLNGFIAFIHKRQIYSHEREYRAVIADFEAKQDEVPGLEIPVDLTRLIKGVIVAPQTPEWMHHAVQLLLDEFLPGVKAERSVHDLKPYV